MTHLLSNSEANGPVNFLHWLVNLMSSSMTAAEKVVTVVAVIAQTGKIEELAVLSGIPARSVERARYRPARDGWLHITGSLGRSIPRTYLPGLPGRQCPITFDDVLNWKATHGQGAFAALKSYAHDNKDTQQRVPSDSGGGGKSYATTAEATQKSYATAEIAYLNETESYAGKLRKDTHGVANSAHRVYARAQNEFLRNTLPEEVVEVKKEIGVCVSEIAQATPVFDLEPMDGVRKPQAVAQVDGRSLARSTEVDAVAAFERYNEMAQRIGLPIARSLTPQRRRALMARLNEHGGIPAWDAILANVERSAFLRGMAGGRQGWRADFDFLLQPRSCAKVFEGSYGNGAHGSGNSPETAMERTMRLCEEAGDRLGIPKGGI